MATMKTKLRKLDDIHPYERNTKRHPPEQIQAIIASVTAYGWDVPIVVDGEGVIIKGHGRYQAAQEMALSSVPCVVRDDLTPEQCRASRIADNRTAVSDFNLDMLRIEIAELGELGIDLQPMGFTEYEMLNLTDPDPDNPGEETRRGAFNAGSPVIQYNVIFSNENDQNDFFVMLKAVKEQYPERTIGEALADFSRDTFNAEA